MQKSDRWFFAGNIDTDLESKIVDTEKLINKALRQLDKLNGNERREKGRIVYYSCIITVLKEIIVILKNLIDF